MTDLLSLARKYNTDKTHYCEFYSMLLEPHRASIRRVLEIGIGTPDAMRHLPGYVPGASLRMWRDYFPNAEIYGLDKDPSVLFREQRIQTACADQTRLETFLHVLKDVSPFDLIVDDGSHTAGDQLKAFYTLKPYCKGLYIIEDADVKGGLLEMLPVPFSYVQVHGELTGHCVVIRG